MRVLVVADSYREAHAQGSGLSASDRVYLAAPSTHPGAVAGPVMDRVVRLDTVPLNRKLARMVEHVTPKETPPA